MKRNQLIVFEGIDGVGKTSVINHIYNFYKSKDIRPYTGIEVIKSPGGSELGEYLRPLLLSNIERDSITNLLLMLSDLRETYVKVISPKLNEGKLLLLDRFVPSTIVYSHALDNLSIELIETLIFLSFGELTYSVIYINTELELLTKRLETRRELPNKYDLESDVKKTKLLKVYQDLCNKNNWIEINNNSSVNEFYKNTLSTIDKLVFPRT